MRIKSARIQSYNSWAINESTVSDIALHRLKKIRLYDQLISEGCSSKSALDAIEVKRSTLYVWRKKYKEEGLKGLNPKSTIPQRVRQKMWTKALKKLVLTIRRENPCWGKEKIHRIMVRDYHITDTSVSTVGRIIKHFIVLGQIKPSPSNHRRKKSRDFSGHARRINNKDQAKKPGEMLQIDHMSVSDLGQTIKDFRAVCPTTKVMVTRVYTRATSRTATTFLEEVIKDLPFPIHSIQVDGGSEFMKDFEAFCEAHDIPLLVLPPRTPEMNGCVERANGTARDEFYTQYKGDLTISGLRDSLKTYQDRYNSDRPHRSLANLTPFEYTESMFKIET